MFYSLSSHFRNQPSFAHEICSSYIESPLYFPLISPWPQVGPSQERNIHGDLKDNGVSPQVSTNLSLQADSEAEADKAQLPTVSESAYQEPWCSCDDTQVNICPGDSLRNSHRSLGSVRRTHTGPALLSAREVTPAMPSDVTPGMPIFGNDTAASTQA